MGIRGIMSQLGLEWTGPILLLMAFSAFVIIVIRVLAKPRSEIDRQASLPLNDDPNITSSSESSAREARDG